MNTDKSLETLMEEAWDTRLSAAQAAEGNMTPVASPTTDHARWGEMGTDSLTWSRPVLFGGGEVKVESSLNMKLVPVSRDRFNTVAEIKLKDPRPTQIAFYLLGKPKEGVQLLHARAGEVIDITKSDAPVFKINVQWKHGNVPHTRERGNDNLDLVFLDPEGSFIQLQISVSTRKGRFFLVIQEIYAGQIVRSTEATLKKLGVTSEKVGNTTATVVPLFQENAYPGADYLRTFPGMGPRIVHYAIMNGKSTTLGKCKVAKWEPDVSKQLPAELANGDHLAGSVKFFNSVTGTGYVRCDDGEDCFVHFTAVKAKNGDFPILDPMRRVALKRTNNPERGNRLEATEISVI